MGGDDKIDLAGFVKNLPLLAKHASPKSAPKKDKQKGETKEKGKGKQKSDGKEKGKAKDGKAKEGKGKSGEGKASAPKGKGEVGKSKGVWSGPMGSGNGFRLNVKNMGESMTEEQLKELF